MTLLHFNGNILQMGVVGNGLGLRGIVGRFRYLPEGFEKQANISDALFTYVILGLYLIRRQLFTSSSAFVGFCLPNIYRRYIAYSIYLRFSSLIFSRTYLRDMQLDGLFLSSLV